MTQPPETDPDAMYDIDDAIVFEKESANYGARVVRNWVRDAIEKKGSNFKTPPETKKKCVRVTYASGHQCDFPVMRRTPKAFGGFTYELSDGDEWVSCDTSEIRNEIDRQAGDNSPENSSPFQLRRILRLGKFFAKTHSARKDVIFPAGLLTTAVILEAYRPIQGRDDESFRETLRAITRMSEQDIFYIAGIRVSHDRDKIRIRRMIDQAEQAVAKLDQLNSDDASEADARDAWRHTFRHSFFDEMKETKSAVAAASIRTERDRRIETGALYAPYGRSES